MSEREELAALRRMAELEAKAGGVDLAGIKKDGSHPTPAEYKPASDAGPRDYMAEMSTKREQAPYETGAKVNDWLASKGVPAPFAAGLGAATNAGMVGGEMMAGGAVGNAAQPVFSAAGRRVMQSALKPAVRDLTTGKADRAVTTLLDEGVNVSRGGANNLREMGNALNQQTAAEIANSTATVNPNAVASRLLDTERRFQSQVNPQADLRAIQDTWTNFATHPQIAGRPAIPVQLAQELKQGTYQQLKDRSYGELGSAATEAQKALARGLKEEIEAGVPAVGPLNARASEVWNALNVTERRALQQGNNNPAGLTALASNPKSAALFALDRSALAKSLLARALYSGRLPALAGASVPAALQMNQGE